MEIIGGINEVINKERRSIVIVDVESINGKKGNKQKLSIELRKPMLTITNILKAGDKIKSTCRTDFKKDKYTNCYNNLVAEKIERI